MLRELLLPDIRELITEGDEATLREVLDQWLPADVADILNDLNDDEDPAVIKLLRGPQRARALIHI